MKTPGRLLCTCLLLLVACGDGDGGVGPVPDTAAPAAVTDLSAATTSSKSVTLTWTASGDDGTDGAAAAYEVRFATQDDVAWDSMTPVERTPAPRPAGAVEDLTVPGLSPNTAYFFQVRVGDESGNWSDISNTAHGITRGASGWSPVGLGLNGTVSALAVFRGELIAGGNFTQAGGTPVHHIARWDGTRWGPLGSGMNAPVHDLMVAGDVLYAGGDFILAGGSSAVGAARWDGTRWEAVGPPVWSADVGYVNALAGLGDEIVAGGRWFEVENGEYLTSVMRFDGERWSRLGGGLSGGSVSSFAHYHGELIVGGLFGNEPHESPPLGCVARWDGEAWRALGPGIDADEPIPGVLALTSFAGELVAGGVISTAGGSPARGIAAWNGDSWRALGPGLEGRVYALGEFREHLVAGGAFGNSGGRPVRNVARWQGSDWESLGDGIDPGVVFDFVVYDGELVAGGSFTQEEGAPAGNIARWFEP